MKVFRVIDFETTGFPPKAGIVEVGWTDVIWEGKNMSIAQTWAKLCDPGYPIEIGAKATHHITEDELKGHPHPDTIIQDLDLNADYVVAHNLKFEQSFYQPSIPGICTLKCARVLAPEAPGYKNQELRYYFNLQLDKQRADPPHRAGPDTYVTAHILLELLKLSAKMGGDFVSRLVQITNEINMLKTIPFGKYRGRTFQDISVADPGYLRWIVSNPQAEPEVLKTAKHFLGMS